MRLVAFTRLNKAKVWVNPEAVASVGKLPSGVYAKDSGTEFILFSGHAFAVLEEIDDVVSTLTRRQ